MCIRSNVNRVLKSSMLSISAIVLLGCGNSQNSPTLTTQSINSGQKQSFSILNNFTSALPGSAHKGDAVATVKSAFNTSVNPLLLQDLTYQLSGEESNLFKIDKEGYIRATAALASDSSYDLKLSVLSGASMIGESEIKIVCGNQTHSKSIRCYDECEEKPACPPKPDCDDDQSDDQVQIIYAPQVNNTIHIPEGKNFVMDYAYPDGGGEFKIYPQADDHAFFFMDNNHTLTTNVPFDFENPQDLGRDNSYIVSITDGNYYQQDLQIIVDNIPDTPPIIEDMTPVTIGDDTVPGTVIGDINITRQGEDGIDFITINSTDFIIEYTSDPTKAHVIVNRELNAKAHADYDLTAIAYNESGTDDAKVLIHVDDISTEAPLMQPLLTAVDENSPANTLVGSVNFKTTGDSRIDGNSIKLYEEDGVTPHSGPFIASFNPITELINIYVKPGYDPDKLDYELVKQYSLKVEASNQAGSAKCCVFIRINDVDEDAPIFISDEPVTKIIPENESHVGHFAATDATLPVHFTIAGGEDADKFIVTQVDNQSFDLDFNASAFVDGAPDFESQTDHDGNNEYIVNVKGTDSTSQHYNKTIAYHVNIKNVVEDIPVIAPKSYAIDPYATPVATIVLTNEPLDGEVTYAIIKATDSSGNDATGLFHVRSSKSNLIERSSSLTPGETYLIQVSASTDAGTGIGFIQVHIN